MNTQSTTFSMSPDKSFLVSSWGVLILMISIFLGIGALLASIESVPESAMYMTALMAMLVVGLFSSTYLATPRVIFIDEDELHIRSLLGETKVAWSEIESARKQDLTRVIRTMGVGGFGGAWGEMSSKEIASFEAYITRAKGHVVLERKGSKPLVLTPVDVEGFLAEVPKRLSP